MKIALTLIAALAFGTSPLLAQEITSVSASGARYQLTAAGQKQSDELFAGAEKFSAGSNNVTEITLTPETMGMVGSDPGASPKDRGLANKMRLMTIRKYLYERPGMYSPEDVEAFRKRVIDGSWLCSVHTRTAGNSSDVCSRTSNNNKSSEILIFTIRPTELTFIHMAGDMPLEELSRVGGTSTYTRPTPYAPPVPPIQAGGKFTRAIPAPPDVPPVTTTQPTPPVPPQAPR